jgi:hypothetical protein
MILPAKVPSLLQYTFAGLQYVLARRANATPGGKWHIIASKIREKIQEKSFFSFCLVFSLFLGLYQGFFMKRAGIVLLFDVFKHCQAQYQKVETNIPRKGIARPQSQFPHSCVGERFIYSHDRSAYSAAGKYVDRS